MVKTQAVPPPASSIEPGDLSAEVAALREILRCLHRPDPVEMATSPLLANREGLDVICTELLSLLSVVLAEIIVMFEREIRLVQ